MKYTNKDLENIAQEVRNLPEELIKRLDDRYLKKDDADSQFVTRIEAKVVGIVLSLGVLALTFWDHLAGFFKASN